MEQNFPECTDVSAIISKTRMPNFSFQPFPDLIPRFLDYVFWENKQLNIFLKKLAWQIAGDDHKRTREQKIEILKIY